MTGFDQTVVVPIESRELAANVHWEEGRWKGIVTRFHGVLQIHKYL